MRRCQIGLSLRRPYRCLFGEAKRGDEGWEQEDQSLLELAELWLLCLQENGERTEVFNPHQSNASNGPLSPDSANPARISDSEVEWEQLLKAFMA